MLHGRDGCTNAHVCHLLIHRAWCNNVCRRTCKVKLLFESQKCCCFCETLCRYKPSPTGTVSDDPTPEYMNLLGMIFSMCGLMLKVSPCFCCLRFAQFYKHSVISVNHKCKLKVWYHPKRFDTWFLYVAVARNLLHVFFSWSGVRGQQSIVRSLALRIRGHQRTPSRCWVVSCELFDTTAAVACITSIHALIHSVLALLLAAQRLIMYLVLSVCVFVCSQIL